MLLVQVFSLKRLVLIFSVAILFRYPDLQELKQKQANKRDRQSVGRSSPSKDRVRKQFVPRSYQPMNDPMASKSNESYGKMGDWLMKNKKILLLGLMLVLMMVLLTACAPGDGTNSVEHPAGFFSGVWHGWIAPITLVISLFNSHINIYEVNNVGFWYNFGYYMAIISGFGGLALSRKSRKSGDHQD